LVVLAAAAVGGRVDAKIAEIAKIKTKRKRREYEERLLSIGVPLPKPLYEPEIEAAVALRRGTIARKFGGIVSAVLVDS
jgi:hypothetical protein